MIAKIINFSVNNKLIVVLFLLGLIGYGAYETSKLPIDAVPDITDNQVQVITVSPSLGAPDVERLVTFPVEQANSNIPGIKEIRSFSRFGLSLVTIVFDDETDIYWARQQVAERLQQVAAKIPDGVGTPELGPVTTGLGEIYQYVVRPAPGYEKQYGPMELRTIQDWMIRRQLLGVKGVADVSSFGGLLKQYEVAVDPNRLQSSGTSIAEVFNALAENNQNTGGSYIEKGPNLLFIRSEGLIRDKSDIESIPVRMGNSGIPVLIRDVAEVRIGHANRFGTMYYNDQQEVSGAVVMMLKGANSNEVIGNVKEKMALIQKTLPKGIIVEPFLDRTKMVNNAIGTVKTNLMEGALIVLFVLILFLGNFRAGFLVASVIPLAMLFAIIMMNKFGVIGNLMSLGALDFGLIVDGAVFIVEAVLHHLHSSKSFTGVNQLNQEQMDGEVKEASRKMARSVVFGQIIILIVYLPTFALQGIEGKMFIPMAQTLAFALIGAFILSITYVPMMSALLLSKKISHKKTVSDKVMENLERFYQKWLGRALSRKAAIIGVSIALMVAAFAVLSQMGGEFIPELEEGDFAVETRIMTGSNLERSMEASKKAAALLKKNYPEVVKVVAKIGSGEIPTDPMPIEAQDLMVILKDKSEWTSAETFDELAEKMGKTLSEIPGVSFGFQFPVQMRFNELMTGARQDIVCKIYGENLDSLAALAAQLGSIAGTVEGAADIYVEPVGGLPQIVIQYNRQAIAAFGASIATINQAVNTAFAGQAGGLVFEGEKSFDLVVRLTKNNRNTLDDVADLLIPVADGKQIPLRQLAEVQVVEGPNQIQREDTKRRIIVGFNARGRDVQSIVEEIKKKTESGMHMPAGYYITYGGAFENLQAAKQRLGIAVPISLLLIFLLLYFAFGSIKDGLLIYSAIPLSAVGGIFTLAARGLPFSISAGVGFIALFGVAVLNGIVLISEFRRLQEEGWTDLRKIVIHGTKVKLRPVLMTAAVASLGFLPMALSNGAGAEVQRPLATVVIGGLLFATLMTLFVLPILYIIFNQKRMKIHPVVPVVAVLLFLGITPAKAQSYIGIQAATDSALKNNYTMQDAYLTTSYFKALESSIALASATAVTAEYGQFNSVFKDNRVGIMQGFSMPQYYAKQKELARSRTQISLAANALTAQELKLEVMQLYFGILFLNAQENAYAQTDSMITAMLAVAKKRMDAGATDRLELDYLQAESLNSKQSLHKVQTERKQAELLFHSLLNTRIQYVPSALDENSLITPAFTDSSVLTNNPTVLLAMKNLESNIKATAAQKAQLLPTLGIGYSSTTIQGTGADNVTYTTSYRFQSMQIAVQVPIFASAIKAEIRAQHIATQKAETQVRQAEQSTRLRWDRAWLEFKNSLETYTNYAALGIQSTENMKEIASKKYAAGEIDYLEYANILHQAANLQINAFTARYQYQMSIAELSTITQP